MLRRLPLFLAPLALTLLLAGPAAAAPPVLKGVVGPGFSITLKTAAGKSVKTLKAGTYTIKVQDKASIHNFHLLGPGVNKKTSVAGTGAVTWTVKLKAGSYTYQCDPHAAAGMKGKIKVS